MYGSVLHPPSLPRHDLLYYNSIALITYLSLLIFACPALFAIYKVFRFLAEILRENLPLFQEKYFFLLPWLTANIVSLLLEFLVFFHLLSKIKKVGERETVSVASCHGARVPCLSSPIC